MQRLIAAAAALTIASGVASAEIAIVGEAKLGIGYRAESDGDSMTGSNHSFDHNVEVGFLGSGTTDGRLSFSGAVEFDTEFGVKEGRVRVGGPFGDLTIGDQDAADHLAGEIGDVGLNGVGVDDIVEQHRGRTAHSLRYDNSVGQFKIAVSAGTANGMAAADAVAATLFWVTGIDNRVTQFSMQPTPLEYEKVFGICREFDLDGAVVGAHVDVLVDGVLEMHNIVGFGRNDDGEIVDDTDFPVESEGRRAAFKVYELAFDLGADGVAGGSDDTRKRQTDNSVDGLPAVPVEDQYAVGMSFEAGGLTVGFGYDSLKTVSLGVGFSAGSMSANALYVRTDSDETDNPNDIDTTGIGAEMAYSSGASTFTLAYAQSRPERGLKGDAYGINLSRELGGGASAVAGFGQVKDVNKASAGLLFKF